MKHFCRSNFIAVILWLCVHCTFAILNSGEETLSSVDERQLNISARNPKFIPWGWWWSVGLVRFANSACSGGDGLEGTCYTRRQCSQLGGISSGNCAGKLAVCCVVRATCGERTSQNSTYFVSPGFPKVFLGGSCSITIQKCHSGICQVRLDFLTLNLAQPNANGVCVRDSLNIIGGGTVVHQICGENSGQHIYIDFNDDSDIQIIINTNAGAALTRSWNIKITQIGCDSASRAPTGCLLYYTGISGTTTSFNYGVTGTATGTRQLVNQNYGICIQMQPGYCSIQWSQSGGDPYSFTLTGDTPSDIATMSAEALSGANCTTDFVVIPNPIRTDGTPEDSDRFCGNAFNSVRTSSKPFVLSIVTDGNDTPDMGNRGFSLTWSQQRCTGIMIGK